MGKFYAKKDCLGKYYIAWIVDEPMKYSIQFLACERILTSAFLIRKQFPSLEKAKKYFRKWYYDYALYSYATGKVLK